MQTAYEIRNPSFGDMNLQQQIEVGINDWCTEDQAGREFFGQTKAAAEKARAIYNGQEVAA